MGRPGAWVHWGRTGAWVYRVGLQPESVVVGLTCGSVWVGPDPGSVRKELVAIGVGLKTGCRGWPGAVWAC